MTIFEQRESNVRGYSRVYPVTFTTAKNARQTDDTGKEYIDFFAGAGVLNFGHNNEAMINAMIDYMKNDGVLHSLDMQTSAKAEFMQTFTNLILEPRNMPHRIQFMGPTGTNAVEADEDRPPCHRQNRDSGLQSGLPRHDAGFACRYCKRVLSQRLWCTTQSRSPRSLWL